MKGTTGMNSNKKDSDIKVVGLTGGIGTGKSTAASYLRDRGFAHIDADEIGRELTADGSSLLPVLDSIFGPEGEMGDGTTRILDDGVLDRKALASVVFSDAERKKRLDDLMFSHIVDEIDRRTEEIKETPGDICGVLIDAPLLFEAGLDSRCDTVLLITADMDKRIDRVRMRDGMSEYEITARIKNQMPDEERKARSDEIIDNSGDVDELYDRLEKMIDFLIK